MANITFTLNDADDEGGVSFHVAVDRSTDTPALTPYPATPAMIVGMTLVEIFTTGAYADHTPPVIQRLMTDAGLSPEEQAECVAKAAATVSNAVDNH